MCPGLRVTAVAAVGLCGLMKKASKGLMDGFALVGRYCRITEFSGFGIYLAWYLGSPCVAPCILVDVETHRLHMSVTVMPCSLARPLICVLCCVASLATQVGPFLSSPSSGCAVVDVRIACSSTVWELASVGIRRGGPCGRTACTWHGAWVKPEMTIWKSTAREEQSDIH